MVKAKDPKGPWSAPVLVKPGKGIIDTCPFWDEDGKVYMVHAYAGSRAGLKSVITICELNAEATQAITPSRIIFDGHEAHQTCEGPKMYKRNDYYYIFHPAAAYRQLAGRTAFQEHLRPLRMENRTRTRQLSRQRPSSGCLGRYSYRRRLVSPLSGCRRLRTYHAPATDEMGERLACYRCG